MDRKRSAGTIAAALAIVAVTVTAPAARGDDVTARPPRPARRARPPTPAAPRPRRRRPRRPDDGGSTTAGSTTATQSATATTSPTSPRPRRPRLLQSRPPRLPRAPAVIGRTARSRPSRTCRSGSSSSAASATPRHHRCLLVCRRPVGPRLPAVPGPSAERRRGPAHVGPPRLRALTSPPRRGQPHRAGGSGPEVQLRLRPWAVGGKCHHGRLLVSPRPRGPVVPAVTRPAAVGRHGRATWARLVVETHRPGTFDRLPHGAGLAPVLPPPVPRRPLPHGRVMCVDKGDPHPDVGRRRQAPHGHVGQVRRAGPRDPRGHLPRLAQVRVRHLQPLLHPDALLDVLLRGQAVHYSSNFARLGYASSSHGCVNIADLAQVKSLFFKVRVGDEVVVRH